MQHKFLSILAVLGVAGFLSGCGGGGPDDAPELGQVTGTVKVDGKPAPNLNVTFQPKDGSPAFGTTDESGVYKLMYRGEEGTEIGPNLVSISTPEPKAATDDGCGNPSGKEFLDPIPPKYNSDARNNSDMTKDVKAGSQEFNFDIKSDPNARKASGGGCAPPRRRGPVGCDE